MYRAFSFQIHLQKLKKNIHTIQAIEQLYLSCENKLAIEHRCIRNTLHVQRFWHGPHISKMLRSCIFYFYNFVFFKKYDLPYCIYEELLCSLFVLISVILTTNSVASTSFQIEKKIDTRHTLLPDISFSFNMVWLKLLSAMFSHI